MTIKAVNKVLCYWVDLPMAAV